MENFVLSEKKKRTHIFPAAEGTGYACGHQVNGAFYLHKSEG